MPIETGEVGRGLIWAIGGGGFNVNSTRLRTILPWLLGGQRRYGNGKVSIRSSVDRRLVRLTGVYDEPGWS